MKNFNREILLTLKEKLITESLKIVAQVFKHNIVVKLSHPRQNKFVYNNLIHY